jgi:hypothetical protein
MVLSCTMRMLSDCLIFKKKKQAKESILDVPLTNVLVSSWDLFVVSLSVYGFCLFSSGFFQTNAHFVGFEE